MARNDAVLIEGILEDRISQNYPSSDLGEVFEFFVLEQLLKDYDFSEEEINYGWIDGGDDGGIDGFYILVNGHLLDDAETFPWPKSDAAIDIYLISCKHHATFTQSTLDQLVATFSEIFDLQVADDELSGSYSERLRECRALFRIAYRQLSIGRPDVRFHIVYASRGSIEQLGDSVEGRSRQIQRVFESLFSSCETQFAFVGAAELVELHRKTRKFTLSLPFIEHFATHNESHVLLVRLDEFRQFVSDESGALRRYLFDSNVRDYLGENPVNMDIARSLNDPSAPDFWWLNNGVTILATNANAPGKFINLQDIQIVNGLQTTETIYEHFKSGSKLSAEKALLVKVIVSSDPQTRDRIIRATNNQSAIELASLHATDRIQRSIEEILERNNWYYERRRNYYRNVGKPHARLIGPIYLASASVSLLLRDPIQATRLRSRFMRNPNSYSAVFSERTPISVWPILVDVYKLVDLFLTAQTQRQKIGEKLIAKWRPVMSLLLVARHFNTFAYTNEQLVSFNASQVTKEDLEYVWKIIQDSATSLVKKTKPTWQEVERCCKALESKDNVKGIARVINRPFAVRNPKGIPLDSDFVNRVDSALPNQPWKPGVHVATAKKLGCNPGDVRDVIQHLIAIGRRHQQVNGIVYDASGKVIATDPERVKQSVEELNADDSGLA